MQSSKTTHQIQAAILDFQLTLEPIVPTRINEFFHSKYADLADVWAHVEGALAAHKLSVVQGGNNGKLQTRLCHISGEWIEDDGYPLITSPDKKGNISMQAQMSAVTYARRYGLASMLGVRVSEEDDDGAAASENAALQPRGGAKGTKQAAPKTKPLTGPIKTITELKKACRQLSTDIAACEDLDTLSGLRTFKPTQDLMAQLKTDWPEALDTERNDNNDFIGLKQHFRERAKALGPQDA